MITHWVFIPHRVLIASYQSYIASHWVVFHQIMLLYLSNVCHSCSLCVAEFVFMLVWVVSPGDVLVVKHVSHHPQNFYSMGYKDKALVDAILSRYMLCQSPSNWKMLTFCPLTVSVIQFGLVILYDVFSLLLWSHFTFWQRFYLFKVMCVFGAAMSLPSIKST